MAYSARQNLLIRSFLAIAAKVGPWAKNHDAEGACYVDENLNAAKVQGFNCRNCAFWKTPNGCAIVKGPIQPQGLCRLHVIQPERVSKPQGQRLRGRISGETFP